MFCQYCGGVVAMPPAMRSTSERVGKIDREQYQRCLCNMGEGDDIIEELGKHERALEKFMSENLPGISMKHLNTFIQVMDKHHPLRTELVQRMQYVKRLKDKKENPSNMPKIFAPNEAGKMDLMVKKMNARPHQWEVHTQLRDQIDSIYGIRTELPRESTLDWSSAFGGNAVKRKR